MRSVAIVTAKSPDGTEGGAEVLYKGLVNAFREANWDASEVAVEFNERNFETIIEGYNAAARLDLLSFDLVVSTKAPTYRVWHPNHSCWLVHTIRVFYDLFDYNYADNPAWAQAARQRIFDMDTAALQRPEVRRFAIGETVRQRLAQYNGLDSICLHPPSAKAGFGSRAPSGYFFTASRLHEWKRIDLLILAVLSMKNPIELRIAGSGPDEARLKVIAGGSSFIKFLGRVSDDILIEQYAGCIGVLFVPLNEDYGYITIEAHLSKKPVITVRDSGEPSRIVLQSNGGIVCQATPAEIAAAMQKLDADPDTGIRMGQRGYDWAQRLSWGSIVENLSRAAL